MSPSVAPEIGSRWRFPAWNNPQYTGPWEVVRVGEPLPGSEWAAPVVVLRRVEDGRMWDDGLHHWPGGWEPVDA